MGSRVAPTVPGILSLIFVKCSRSPHSLTASHEYASICFIEHRTVLVRLGDEDMQHIQPDLPVPSVDAAGKAARLLQAGIHSQ